MRDAEFFKKQAGGVLCLLCPNHCLIDEGGVGRCLGRGVQEGSMRLRNYARVVAASVDPVEKKPLYHLFPGQPVYSIGSYGCNLRCQFCQNADISQHQQPSEEIMPAQLVSEAVSTKDNIGVAFTYNEPGIWYEYILDCAPLLKAAGLMTIMVTNGYLCEDPWKNLCRVVDAMNIDLKAFNNDFYKNICGGHLETVKTNIKTAVNAGVHVELTNLVVTGLNDDEEEFKKMVKWVADLSDTIPFHISRYFPRYLETAVQTPSATINRFVELAREHLKYVYPGNLPANQDTRCPDCGALWVKRDHYNTVVV
ncbi:MAG: AmmeMemoRadiSam system radical SAM enzyme, partial [Erysipelotrichia bacterium]|nr:AmmeMemoRadiSam system radical SAM enzyme [Erysipelotrichia bacterium]